MRDWGHGEEKLWWEVVARNKKSVSANLRIPEGQDIVRRLAAKADILIENFKPGTMEKWGLGPDELHAINPRLIIVRANASLFRVQINLPATILKLMPIS